MVEAGAAMQQHDGGNLAHRRAVGTQFRTFDIEEQRDIANFNAHRRISNANGVVPQMRRRELFFDAQPEQAVVLDRFEHRVAFGFHDAIYHFKNYGRECEILSEIIQAAAPGARTILDVACGTGEHAKFLKEKYAIDGVDLNEEYLRAARTKNPAGKYTRADMTDFDLATTYDVVTCLFSAVGYVRTVDRMNRAIASTARHLKPTGVLIGDT